MARHSHKSWITTLLRMQRRKSRLPQRRHRAHVLELLEARALLATFQWTGAVDNQYGNPGNWIVTAGPVPAGQLAISVAPADIAQFRQGAIQPAVLLNQIRDPADPTGGKIIPIQSNTWQLLGGATVQEELSDVTIANLQSLGKLFGTNIITGGGGGAVGETQTGQV